MEERDWELLEAVCEGHMLPLESLTPMGIVGNYRDPPKTKVRGYHVSERETNSLACAYHTPMCGQRMKTRRSFVEAKDANEPTSEARVIQYLTEERRYRSKDFDHITYPKITKNTVEEDGESW